MHSSSGRPTIALLPWGDVFEDFLDTIGVSLDTFCNELTGGWLFGYVEALHLRGIHAVVIIFSAQVSAPVRRTHAPTGATICILPSPKLYRILSRMITKSYGAISRIQHRLHPIRHLLNLLLQSLERFASYLSTPMGPLARELDDLGCDAVICQEYEYARFDLCVLLGFFTKIPVFATFQGGVRNRGMIGRWLRAAIIRTSAGLIIGPQSEAERVYTYYRVPSAKIARIFNPLDLRLWKAVDRETVRTALQIPLAARVVVWHGRISIHHKGLDILLDAWEHICSEHRERELRLLLIGTGQDAQEFRRRLEARQLPGIQWVNEYLRDRVMIQQHLSVGDVFAFASRFEGFAVAPLEAMACGLPVVATRVAGIPDIFEGGEASGGIVVPCEDPKQLALMLLRLLDDVALSRKLGRCARQRVEAAFSLEAIGQQLSHVLIADAESRDQVAPY